MKFLKKVVSTKILSPRRKGAFSVVKTVLFRITLLLPGDVYFPFDIGQGEHVGIFIPES